MSEARAQGRFIAFEGGEGTGKSTQARLLADALMERGHSVDVTREPGGTDRAEAIRSLLLIPPGEGGWGARAEALLFAAARADHVEQRIRPELAQGSWVICDRFVDSSRAYQGGAGGLGDEAILGLHGFGSEGLLPDLTLLLEVNEKRVAHRLMERDGDNSDAIGGRSAEYHARVRDAFRKLASHQPERFAVIDGEGTPIEVHARILAAIDERLS